MPAELAAFPVAAIVVAAVGLIFLLAVLAAWRRRRGAASPKSPPAHTGPPTADEAVSQGLRRGLAKTRSGIWQRLAPLLSRGRLDAEAVEELEAVLLGADVGVRTTERLMQALKDERGGANASLTARLEHEVLAILEGEESGTSSQPRLRTGHPHVIMVVGVNGVGKTTSIGKLAARFVNEGKHVMLVAGDTFRAAAIEQLTVWAERTGADLVRHQHGADPGAVAYDGLKAAVARKIDVAIVDTAGRLHTKSNLMDELRKIRRVIAREVEGAPHETLLVIDAVTGQNGLAQARAFLEHLEVTGIILTKLDGTARGGIALAIAGELHLPVRYVGVGEGVDDLRVFEAKAFASALVSPAEPSGMP